MKATQEFTVTAETASPQVDVHKDGARVGTHTNRHTHPDLGSEPYQGSPPCNLDGRIVGNVSLSSPFDPQNVLSLPCAGQACQQSVSLTFILSSFSMCKHVHY